VKRIPWLPLIPAIVAIGFNGYVRYGSNRVPMDITLAGFILWSWAPYLIALLCLKAKFHPIIVFSAITFALSQDLLYFHQIHLGLRGETAAFGVLLFRPCFNLLVFMPIAAICAWPFAILIKIRTKDADMA